MNRINLFLLFLLLISTVTPSFTAASSTKRLTELKELVTNNVHKFVKCVKGHKDCSRESQIIARVTVALLFALGVATTVKLSSYVFNRRKIKDESLESLLNRKNEKQNQELRLTTDPQPNLFAAVKSGDLTEVKKALEAGANVHIPDSNGYQDTALNYAVDTAKPNIKVIEFLIGSGADVNQSDKNGSTPLTIASGHNSDTQTVALLLKEGAAVNVQTSTGNTALHKAVISDKYDNALMLINNGANVNIKNREGQTALDIVTSEKMRNLLIGAGALSKN